jgi:hypothetical protein
MLQLGTYLRPVSAAALGVAMVLCAPAIAVELTQAAGLIREAVEEFESYLASQNYEKAFVIGRNGRVRWLSGRRTAEDAVTEALKGCQQAAIACKPYAINDALVDSVR